MDANIQKYQAFVEVADAGSFTKAAETLAYSQSGISHMVSDLERDWGVALFERSRRGVVLTGDGARLLPEARALCESFRALEATVDEVRGLETGLIRIGVFPSVAAHWIPRIIKRFNADYPGIDYKLRVSDYTEIEEAASWGALAGVTTNPTLYSRIGGKLDDFHAHIKRICDIVGPDCPVSAESVAMTRDEIVRDGRELAAIAPNVVVKIPTMVEGLAATRALADEGIPVNMTLCFTVPQAILAARAGARYISPFVGRFDDISEDGLAQLDDVVRAIGNYDFSEDTVNGEQIEIIAASIRSANHVTQAALMGADIATVPFGILKKCVQHPLTDRGLESFLKDWEKVQNA